MKKTVYLGGIMVLSILASCKKNPVDLVGLEPDGYVLFDEKFYGYKVYGNQTWMTDNLVFLPYVVPSSTYSDNIAYYYVYGYEGTSPVAAKATANFKTYGVLYNWAAAKIACPPGWHLPSDEEWKTLEIFLGMSESEVNSPLYRPSGSVGYKMKSTSGWRENGNGDNSSGFKVLPGGNCSKFGGFLLGEGAYFWSSTPNDETRVWSRHLIYHNVGVERGNYPRNTGFSVRCLKDQIAP